MEKKCKILVSLVLFLFFFIINSYGKSDFSYELDSNKKLTITSYHGNEENLVIPSTIDGHKVEKIGAHAFNEERNNTNGNIIKNLVISEGIKQINRFAFANCKNLESVKLPQSLEVLEASEFIQCEKLKKINIPSKLKSLSINAFQETAIEEIEIPKNIKKFTGSEFRLCKNLKKVKIYNDNINYYNNSYDTNVFEYDTKLVLYGNEGSTTQEYAKRKNIQFKLLNEEDNTINQKIILNKNILYLKQNESENLSIKFIEIEKKKIIWSSSNKNIAIVNNGKVIAKKEGKAIITASTEDHKLKAECIVIVKKDNTIAPGKLPKTGNKFLILVIIIIGMIISFINKKLMKYKNIN